MDWFPLNTIPTNQTKQYASSFHSTLPKHHQIEIVTYELSPGPPGLRANLGAVIPEKAICFSGGGAPLRPRIIIASPEII